MVATFEKTALSQRKYCTRCGGHLMAVHPPLGLIDVFAATLPTLKFRPGVHVNYGETVLPMRDGLPKLRDFPAEHETCPVRSDRALDGAIMTHADARDPDLLRKLDVDDDEIVT